MPKTIKLMAPCLLMEVFGVHEFRGSLAAFMFGRIRGKYDLSQPPISGLPPLSERHQLREGYV